MNNVADELYSIAVVDGAGRVIGAAGNHPGSVGGYSLVNTIYDQIGWAWKQSNPTEVNNSWVPSGDDAAGIYYTQQTYDWKGRPLITTKSDGKTREASYSGCGCAGGEVLTHTDEGTIDNGVPKRRQQKIYSDVLGRTVKTEILNWQGGSIYSATKFLGPKLTGCLVLLLTATRFAYAEPWRGIVPLHTTRAAVEQKLGQSTMDHGDTVVYDYENERASIEYSKGPCSVKLSQWNVPRDTVISIWITPKTDLHAKDLGLDKNYKRVRDEHRPQIIHYIDERIGIEYNVDEASGTVGLIKYLPSAADKNLRCPGVEPRVEILQNGWEPIFLGEWNISLTPFVISPSLDAPNGACYVAASPVIPYLNNASLKNSGARVVSELDRNGSATKTNSTQ